MKEVQAKAVQARVGQVKADLETEVLEMEAEVKVA